jgi:hypothetical protein
MDARDDAVLAEDVPLPERRRHARAEQFLEASLVHAARRSPALRVRLLDLSAGGLRIETDALLERGDVLDLRLDIADGPTLSSAAVVRWEGSDGFRRIYGIELASLGRWQRWRLSRALQPGPGFVPAADSLLGLGAGIAGALMLGDYLARHGLAAHLDSSPSLAALLGAGAAWVLEKI